MLSPRISQAGDRWATWMPANAASRRRCPLCYAMGPSGPCGSWSSQCVTPWQLGVVKSHGIYHEKSGHLMRDLWWWMTLEITAKPLKEKNNAMEFPGNFIHQNTGLMGISWEYLWYSIINRIIYIYIHIHILSWGYHGSFTKFPMDHGIMGIGRRFHGCWGWPDLTWPVEAWENTQDVARIVEDDHRDAKKIPSGNLLHSYWKSPLIVDFPIKNGDVQ